MTSKQQQQQRHVRVGVGVLVKKDSSQNIYCGIRKGSHGAGSLALPGGHLELNETWKECARREIMEEMGVSIDNVEFAHVTNDIMKAENKHYVTIFMMATCTDEPINMEPHKCQGWKAYTWEELRDLNTHEPNKLFGPLAKLVEEEPQTVLDFVGGAASVAT
jgi:8-oxo-dGTP diphosphatase